MATKPLYRADLMPVEAKQQMEKEIEIWFDISEKVSKLSEQEKELRAAIFNKYFASAPGVKEGTNHINLDYGKMLTADYRINRKVDEAQLDAAISLGTIPRTLVDDLISYKPSLRTGEWKEASPEVKKLFGDIVTETPGTPALKITTPKR